MTEAETYLAKQGVVPGCRWGRTRKAAFLFAIGRWPEGSAALIEAHNVSADEIVSWKMRQDRLGHRGLQAGVVIPAEERKRALDADVPPPHRRRSAQPLDPWRDR